LKRGKRRSEKTGLPPGTPVHVGEQKSQRTKITVIDYDEQHLEEREVETVEECAIFKDQPNVTWINVAGLHQVEVLQQLGDCFGLHPLVLEDILNTMQRPKMEDFDDCIYVVVQTHYYNEKSRKIVTEQISLVLGPSFVLSFQEWEADLFDPIRERIRSRKGHIREMGPDYLAYALLDAIVDGYFAVLENLGEDIELLEEELVAGPGGATLHRLHDIKREVIFLRKSVWPLREAITGLARGDSPLVKETTRLYLRDVYDHSIQVIDTVETFRDMLSGILDIYLSSISNRMNEVMKVLTIIATIFIPLTFIAGVYGMNFEYMPELAWRWAYPAVWLVMAAVGVTMAIYFKRRKWI